MDETMPRPRLSRRPSHFVPEDQPEEVAREFAEFFGRE
jgi:hypothetical protein